MKNQDTYVLCEAILTMTQKLIVIIINFFFEYEMP